MPNDDYDAVIPGSDVKPTIYRQYQPIPVFEDPANPHLPKTDWSRDGIIASDD